MDPNSNCTLFIAEGKGGLPSAAAIQKKLENPQDDIKAEGMQELITGKGLGFRV